MKIHHLAPANLAGNARKSAQAVEEQTGLQHVAVLGEILAQQFEEPLFLVVGVWPRLCASYTPDLPVLFVSDYTGDRLAQLGIEHTGNFLSKPFSAGQLCQAVAGLMVPQEQLIAP